MDDGINVSQPDSPRSLSTPSTTTQVHYPIPNSSSRLGLAQDEPIKFNLVSKIVKHEQDEVDAYLDVIEILENLNDANLRILRGHDMEELRKLARSSSLESANISLTEAKSLLTKGALKIARGRTTILAKMRYAKNQIFEVMNRPEIRKLFGKDWSVFTSL
jgi:hypothetical protein